MKTTGETLRKVLLWYTAILLMIICTFDYHMDEENETSEIVIVKDAEDYSNDKIPQMITETNTIIKSDSIQVSNQSQEVVQDEITEPDNTNELENILVTELVSDTSDVTKPSNATVEELNRAIESTCKWMYEYDPNLGEIYYNLEQEYGINAYFALSVSIQEVGVQEMSNLAKK